MKAAFASRHFPSSATTGSWGVGGEEKRRAGGGGEGRTVGVGLFTSARGLEVQKGVARGDGQGQSKSHSVASSSPSASTILLYIYM